MPCLEEITEPTYEEYRNRIRFARYSNIRELLRSRDAAPTY